jgi:hypothetical protein
MPPLVVRDLGEKLDVVLGSQGRQALLGELRLAPETLGVDVTRFMGDNPGIHSGVVWCAEPLEWLGDTLVVSAGLTWWPPGKEPKQPTRSITEALMRCLGFLDARPWARATIYVRPASLPRVDLANQRPLMQEGTETLMAALEQAFAFGLSAPFQARGLSLNTGTQDGAVAEADRGVERKGRASISHDGRGWTVANQLVYAANESASSIPLPLMGGRKASTVVEGVSYLLAKGSLGALMPSSVERAALRVKTGLGRSMFTMTARVRADASPGLSCVLRALSPPRYEVTPSPVDGGVAPEAYPGVDLQAAQKCQLSDADESGPVLQFK